MRRLLIASLLIFSIGAFANTYADDEQVETLKPEINLGGVAYIQEEPAAEGIRLNKNVLFIFDCSGSMSSSKIQEALTFFTGLSSQPVDQMQLAILAFDSPDHNGNGGLYRWPGIPEPDGPKPILKGWAGLPSLTAIKKATKWVHETRGHAGGGTQVIPAIRKAYQEIKDELSIILVTDGDFSDTAPGVLTANEYILASLKTAIKTREMNKKLTSTAMMIYGVGSHRQENLAQLAKLGGAGYYHKKPMPKSEEEDLLDDD